MSPNASFTSSARKGSAQSIVNKKVNIKGVKENLRKLSDDIMNISKTAKNKQPLRLNNKLTKKGSADN